MSLTRQNDLKLILSSYKNLGGPMKKIAANRLVFFSLITALFVSANAFSKQPPPPDFIPPAPPVQTKSFKAPLSVEDKKLMITSVTFEEVPSIYDAPVHNYVTRLDTQYELPDLAGDLKSVIAIIDDLIAIGKKIWPIIDKNRPVITTDLKSMISVLPRLEGNRVEMDLMENWSMPVAKSYRLALKNGFNSDVIAFTYTVIFQHSGTHDGKGKYLTSVKILANEIYASWGFNFDAKSEMINIANVGSKANPVASAIFQVNYKGKGLLNEIQGAHTFYVDGNGGFQVLK